jgi:DNA repair exonuclease SbcCD ATPase subunit
MSFQETVKRTLTQDIAKIVKSIEGSAEAVQKEIEEAEHRAELRRQESEAQQQRWRREDDQRQIAKSISDSREQLNQVIQAWAKAVSIEQFLKGVEERASNLSEAQRETVQDRLRLAREFIGVQDPFEFLLSWKSPGERYVPLAARKAGENL